MIQLTAASGCTSREYVDEKLLTDALMLSCLTQRPFQFSNLKFDQYTEGLKSRHLSIIAAFTDLCAGHCEGAELHSQEIAFYPRSPEPGTVTVKLGVSGSVVQVLQSLVPVACFAAGRVRLKFSGATDTVRAPSWDYWCALGIPLYQDFVTLRSSLKRRGFYPEGIGAGEILITPGSLSKSLVSGEKGVAAVREDFPALHF